MFSHFLLILPAGNNREAAATLGAKIVPILPILEIQAVIGLRQRVSGQLSAKRTRGYESLSGSYLHGSYSIEI